MKNASLVAALLSTVVLAPAAALADAHSGMVGDDVIAAQRAALADSSDGAGFGPQAPRDIDVLSGANTRVFSEAPPFTRMNLCNIHFHANAEHKGGDFTKFAGNGDGEGYGTGFEYAGTLTQAELAPLDRVIGDTGKGGLEPGDTIEVHYVHTTAQIEPGPTLGACLSESVMNPQLRVETQVYVLVNDAAALDFGALTEHGMVDGVHQALNIPTDTGAPVQYEGSTTGAGYNEVASPLKVSWSVRPRVAKVDIATVETWLESNTFEEEGAHSVRNLVTNPALLSTIN